MRAVKTLNPWPHIKTCPHCGHDEFFTVTTWRGTRRFLQIAANSYRNETVHYKDEEFLLIQCHNCHEEINDQDDLWIQQPGFSPRKNINTDDLEPE